MILLGSSGPFMSYGRNHSRGLFLDFIIFFILPYPNGHVVQLSESLIEPTPEVPDLSQIAYARADPDPRADNKPSLNQTKLHWKA